MLAIVNMSKKVAVLLQPAIKFSNFVTHIDIFDAVIWPDKIHHRYLIKKTVTTEAYIKLRQQYFVQQLNVSVGNILKKL